MEFLGESKYATNDTSFIHKFVFGENFHFSTNFSFLTQIFRFDQKFHY